MIELLATVRELATFAVRRAREQRIAQVASSLTFTTVLSLVPLFTIVFAALTALPAFSDMQTGLREWFVQNLVPPTISDTIFRYLNQFTIKARGLTLIGSLFLVVTASSTMLTIDRALNTIWHVRRPRPLSRRILVYWAIITIGPVLFAGSLSFSSHLIEAYAGYSKTPPFMAPMMLTAIPVTLMTLAFAALYVFVPNRRVKWRDALIGGLFAATAFEFAKHGFAAFIANFRTYTIIYGALAALPIFLLWIYLSWLVALAGAIIAATLPMLRGRKWERGQAPGQDYADALRVLRALCLARAHPAPGLITAEVLEQAELGGEEAEQLLERIEACGLVVRVRRITQAGSIRIGRDDLWILAADPKRVTIERLFRLFAFDGKRVARVGLAIDDPLSASLRATVPINGETCLAEAWNVQA